MTGKKVIISCAVTGGMTVPGQSPAIPKTPEEIINSSLEAHAAGAAIIHIHVRDPFTGMPSAELGLFADVLDGIRANCDAIVQPTTGGGVGMTIDERARVVVELRPEMATFNLGSFNFGIFTVHHRPEMAPFEIEYLESTRDYVFKNTFADMYKLAGHFRAVGTKPEFEAYDVGHLFNLKHLLDNGIMTAPFHLQFVLGVLGASGPTLSQLLHMLATAKELFGTDAFSWSVAGVGYPAEFHMGASALTLGGHFRVGLEDNLRVSADHRATSNAQLVDKAVALIQLLDRDVAKPDEARRILGIVPAPVAASTESSVTAGMSSTC
jgi:uncharacterized protein (DUF849 family)